jgi:hypothetical protein
MSLVYNGGVAQGRIGLNKFFELTSTAAAKLFGLFPRKGTIADGSEEREDTGSTAWTLLLALGRALVVLFLAGQTERRGGGEYIHAGRRWHQREERESELGTRFGKVTWRRPIGRAVGARRACADLPVDRDLGLCGGFSLGVVMGWCGCARRWPTPGRARPIAMSTSGRRRRAR